MQELEFHPLANQYPLLDGQDFEDLKQSIQEAGQVRIPIVLYEGKILDGRNRYRAAKDVGAAFETREYDPAVDGEDPAEFVYDMNTARRHEELDVIRGRHAERQERIRRIAQARREGNSLRQIAEKEGVSVTQVQKDIKAATVHGGCTVEPPDGKVTGKDGKKRAAVTREPGCDDDVYDERDERRDAKKKERNKPRKALKDQVGNVVPDHLRDVFGDPILADSVTELYEIRDKVISLQERVKAKIMHYQFALVRDFFEHAKDLENAAQYAAESLNPGIPYAVCPDCNGDEEGMKSCKTCRFSGHVSKSKYEELEFKEVP